MSPHTRIRITEFDLQRTSSLLTSMVASMDDENCTPCQLRRRREEELAVQALTDTSTADRVTWTGVIGVEGEMTGDGRMIEPNALRWENLPLPLRHAPIDNGGHDGAVVVGRITSVGRNSSGQITATGDFDSNSPEGREAIRQVSEDLTTGVSMDLDDVSFEIRVASDLLDMADAEETDEGQIAETDAEGRVTVLEISADDEVMVTTDGRVRAATIVSIPAFDTARIALDGPTDSPGSSGSSGSSEDSSTPTDLAGRTDDTSGDETEAALVASAIPVDPPAAWFSDPRLTEPTPLSISEDGQVYGHLATWDTCHTSNPQGATTCTPPPRSATGYAYFRTGSIITAEGSEVAVGRLTMDTRHATPRNSPASAMRHYDDTGTAVADVAAGEDSFGIWVAGALRPGITPEQIRALRSSPLSGDWRRVGTSLELVAALAVNVPGFPVPRPSGMVASAGAVTSLVAAGMLPPRRVRRPGLPGSLSADDLRYLKRLADRERREDLAAQVSLDDRAADMARRVRASALAARVRRV